MTDATQLDPRLLTDIRFAEAPGGVPVLTAYRDSRGYWTIGYGYKFPDQSVDYTGYTITAQRAEDLLESRAASAQQQAMQLPEWSRLDTPCRQNAVTELVYNMGCAGWLGFTHARAAIKMRNWQVAHDELLNSDWHAQVHDARANRIANYLLNGVYPA